MLNEQQLAAFQQREIGTNIVGINRDHYEVGEIGIEIEVIGAEGLPGTQHHWRKDVDGSLHAAAGEEAAEYILRKPVSRADLPKVLEYFKRRVADVGTFRQTHQTSVHVHLNCQDRTITEVFTEVAAYLIVEDLLVQTLCDNTRPGNLFCLRASDAEDYVDACRQAIRSCNLQHVAQDRYRYSSCNLASLRRYGSIEFRAHHGTVDVVEINEWVQTLLAVRDFARSHRDPQELVKQFSNLGPDRFVAQMFSKLPDVLRKLTANRRYTDYLWEGMHRAQEVAFAAPSWAERSKVKPAAAPIGEARPQVVGRDPDIGHIFDIIDAGANQPGAAQFIARDGAGDVAGFGVRDEVRWVQLDPVVRDAARPRPVPMPRVRVDARQVQLNRAAFERAAQDLERARRHNANRGAI